MAESDLKAAAFPRLDESQMAGSCVRVPQGERRRLADREPIGNRNPPGRTPEVLHVRVAHAAPAAYTTMARALLALVLIWASVVEAEFLEDLRLEEVELELSQRLPATTPPPVS